MNLPSEMNPAQLPHMLRDSAARSGQDFTVSPLEFRELEATSAWGSQPGSRAQAARFDMAAQAEKIRILAERVNIEIRLGRERLEQQKSEARSAQDAKQAEYMQRIAQAWCMNFSRTATLIFAVLSRKWSGWPWQLRPVSCTVKRR